MDPSFSPGLSLKESVIDKRSTYFGSFSPRKYKPRSCTQFDHAEGPILFGTLNTGSAGANIFTGTVSSETRFPLTLAGCMGRIAPH